MRHLQIVDDINYVNNNCYQHQLLKSLRKYSPNIVTISLKEFLLDAFDVNLYDNIISTLKLRTLDKFQDKIANKLKYKKLVVYDQDCWEAFRVNGTHEGAYDRILDSINVDFFAVTMKQYVDYLNSIGVNSKHVRIWMLPEYCDELGAKYENRNIDISFMGTMYPWRQKLMDYMKSVNIKVDTKSNSKTYHQYLDDLLNVKIFLCSHKSEFDVKPKKLYEARHGMHHKDIEVASRGCFSISDKTYSIESYYDVLKTPAIIHYDDMKQIPDIISYINNINPEERYDKQVSTIEYIRNSDFWSHTAKTLLKYE